MGGHHCCIAATHHQTAPHVLQRVAIRALQPRTVHAINQHTPGGSDALAAAAAALAAASLALNFSRPALAAEALYHSQQLYAWASSPAVFNISYCDTVVPCQGAAYPREAPWSAALVAAQAAAIGGGATPAPVEVPWVAYPSSSVLDDLAWAGAWLHRATGECDDGRLSKW